jgi:very-short-patch-repair endonuclease
MRNSLAQRRATRLRKRSTDAERRLWYFLRKENLRVRFRRQVPVGPYIADFASLDARVIVEVDGSQHTVARDAMRDEFLRQRGFRVLRFWDNDVLTRTEAVVEVIRREISKRRLPSP